MFYKVWIENFEYLYFSDRIDFLEYFSEKLFRFQSFSGGATGRISCYALECSEESEESAKACLVRVGSDWLWLDF